MASFENAIPTILKHEGGYCNVAGDRGGETYKGIARNMHPDWPGWSLIDEVKKVVPLGRLNMTLEADERVQRLVLAFYKFGFWQYSGVRSQVIATKVFDMAVNMGSGQAHKLLQRALGACDVPVTIDGGFGPQTESATNQAPEDKLLEALRDQCAKFYKSLVAKNPSQEKFLTGWLRRAYS